MRAILLSGTRLAWLFTALNAVILLAPYWTGIACARWAKRRGQPMTAPYVPNLLLLVLPPLIAAGNLVATVGAVRPPYHPYMLATMIAGWVIGRRLGHETDGAGPIFRDIVHGQSAFVYGMGAVVVVNILHAMFDVGGSNRNARLILGVVMALLIAVNSAFEFRRWWRVRNFDWVRTIPLVVAGVVLTVVYFVRS